MKEFTGAIGLVIALLLCCFPANSEDESGDSTTFSAARTAVAMVNGEPISARFFARRMTRNRAAAYRHFSDVYGAQDNQDFWNADFDGEKPIDWIRQRTLEECAIITLQLKLAREKDVIPDSSYIVFMDALERENARRREALATGKPIYGPQQYREDEYFDYTFSNIVIELKRRMQGNEVDVSEERLFTYYEEIKGERYARGDRITVKAITIPFGIIGEGEGEGVLSRQEAARRINQAAREVRQGREFEEVIKSIHHAGTPTEMVFDDSTKRFDSRHLGSLREAAEKLYIGEISPIIETSRGFYIIKCIAREPLGFKPFEEVRLHVRSAETDRRYEEIIRHLVAEAKIEIIPEVYNNIGFESGF